MSRISKPVPSRMLRIDEVCAQTGLPRRSVYAEISEGRFPRPVQISARAVAWLDCEVDAWKLARIAQRDGRAA